MRSDRLIPTIAIFVLSITVHDSIATAAEPDDEPREVVVTGTRVQARARLDTLAPVDVLASQTLSQHGNTELAQALSTLAPSLDFPRPSITDGTDHVRP